MARLNVEAERKRQILHATCECIATLGFRSVRVADVAESAGVSSGTIHYYFDSKDSLLHEAFAFNFENSVQRHERMLDVHKDPLERLRHMLKSYLPMGSETITAWRVWVELWAAALGSEELQRLNDSVYENWRSLVRDAVDGAHEAGALNKEIDVDNITDILVGMLDGLAIQALLESSHMTRERILGVCDAFVESILIDGNTVPQPRVAAPLSKA